VICANPWKLTRTYVVLLICVSVYLCHGTGTMGCVSLDLSLMRYLTLKCFVPYSVINADHGTGVLRTRLSVALAGC
jgi:hypothetical protein